MMETEPAPQDGEVVHSLWPEPGPGKGAPVLPAAHQLGSASPSPSHICLLCTFPGWLIVLAGRAAAIGFSMLPASNTQPCTRALIRTCLERSLGTGQQKRPTPMGEGHVREQSWMRSAPLPPGSPSAPAPGDLRRR